MAQGVGWWLGRTVRDLKQKEVIDNMRTRVGSWWVMVIVFCLSSSGGPIGSVLLFALISFLALREFVTLTPTRKADHWALLAAFFIILPLNYWLIAVHWYGLFSIFIPVYAYLWIPIRSAIAGDTTEFLARSAKMQWALMVCVYFVSYAPALLSLRIPGYEGQTVRLLLFLVVVVQSSDVLQYVFGKLFGKTKISPNVSPNKTLEGLIGGIVSAVAIGASLWWITPFSPWQAAAMALAIALMGFAGGFVMSAIKRERGVKDYGALIPGHGGMMDRIDSLCFAAPIFFHLTRYFFAH
jgi:phosphatidate cytidylyltransferase